MARGHRGLGICLDQAVDLKSAGDSRLSFPRHSTENVMENTEYSTLLLHTRGKVAVVQMNRGERRNALEQQLREDLFTCFQSLSQHEEVKVIILTGTSNAFCAGGDLNELRHGLTVSHARKYIHHANKIILAIREVEKPVIAAVSGSAIGAGFSMALACDLLVASKDARFGQAFVHVGAVPDMGSNYFAPRLLGLQRAKELAFTGRILTGQDLFQMGVVNVLASCEELEKVALDLADRIAQGPPLALGLIKRLLNMSWHCTLEEMLELEAQSQAACFQSQDHREGIAAFYENRKPQFKGK
jgi:2-(1,2-epoxy-1,2-dihydrophenyl)acetyl-CoA isomerase